MIKIILQNHLEKVLNLTLENIKLIKKNLNLGGAGMVFSALKKLDSDTNFLTIASSKYKKIFTKLKLTDIIFTDKIIIEKKRFWQNNKLLFQINNIKLDQKRNKKISN